MRPIFIGLLTLLFVTFLPAFAADCEQRLQGGLCPSEMPFNASNQAKDSVKLEIIYPKNNAKINASSIFITGNTEPDASLTINGQCAKVYPNGAFVEVIGLNRGVNNIKIKAVKQHAEKEILYTINVPEYEKTIPAFPVKIQESSISPSQNLLYKAGDIINVSFKASEGLKANFSIGEKVKNISMIEQPPKNISAAPVFGKETQVSAMPVKGIYKGFYQMKLEDNFSNEPIKVELVSDKEKISSEAKGKLSSINTPLIAQVIKDYAVTRTGPNQSRLTPLPIGTMLNITGKIGDTYRFKYSNSLDGWISESDIKVLPTGNFLPETTVRLLNIDSDPNYVYLKIPLAQKVPFLIDQSSENQMNLKLFGVNADIDLYSYDNATDFLKELKWSQESNDYLKLAIKTNSKQFWGYKYYYEGDNLVLKLRKPPLTNAAYPLAGKIICIDAGHGGTETGALGPTGVPEKDINFGIADKLRRILEQKGAKVIMTRKADETVGLNDRVNIANQNEAQIILSIHNNSLPDGRDPYKEHGSSAYYYHSQSLPLAKCLHSSLIQATGFKDFGVFYDSLVLTRPTEALSVLLEVGFMIDPDEYNLLLTPEFQERAAIGITQGLENFFLSQIYNNN